MKGKVWMIRTRKATGTTLVQVPMDMMAQAGILQDHPEPMDMEVDQEGEYESSSEKSVMEWSPPQPIRNKDGDIKIRPEPEDFAKQKGTTKSIPNTAKSVERKPVKEKKEKKEKKESTSTRTATIRSCTAASSSQVTNSRASEVMARGRAAGASMTGAPMPMTSPPMPTSFDHHLQPEFPDHGGHAGRREPQPYSFVPQVSVKVRVDAQPTPSTQMPVQPPPPPQTPSTKPPTTTWKCPVCAGGMVTRQNKTSKMYFWGCRQYPSCKGTRSLQDPTDVGPAGKTNFP